MQSIYISYAWGNNDQDEESQSVTSLVSCLEANGYNVIYDKINLNYKDSLPAFFKEIANGSIVIPIIGIKYLKSVNCLLEASNMLIRGDLESRIFPIVLSSMSGIYNQIERYRIVDEINTYWRPEIEQLKSSISFNNSLGHTQIFYNNELNILEKLPNFLSEFVNYIGNRKQLSYDVLRNENFQSLLELISNFSTTGKKIKFYYNRFNEQHFGRQDSISFVNNFLSDPNKTFLLLYGVGGMGKSHLISTCLDEYTESNAIVWVKADLNFNLRDLFRTCNIPYPDQVENEQQIFITFLRTFTKRDIYLIIDDYYEIIDPLVRRLIAEATGINNGKILIISRAIPTELQHKSYLRHYIKPLDKVAFFATMQNYISGTDKRIYSQEDLNLIYNKCQGYPLGGQLIIRLADFGDNLAAIINNIPTFEAEIDQEGRRFSERLLDNIFKKADIRETSLLCEFSALFGSSTLADIKNLPSFNMHTFDTLVNRRKFINQDGNLLYSMHAMVKDFAYDKLENKHGIHEHLGLYFEALVHQKSTPQWELIENTIAHFQQADYKLLFAFGDRLLEEFDLKNINKISSHSPLESIRNLSAMLQIYPDNKYYKHRLGISLRAAGKLEDAIKLFEEMKNDDKNNTYILNQLAICYRDQRIPGSLDRAISLLNLSLEYSYKNKHALSELAFTLKIRGNHNDLDRCIELYCELQNLEPYFPTPYINLFRCYNERNGRGDKQKAFQVLLSGNKFCPNNTQLKNELGQYFLDNIGVNNYLHRAIALLEESLEIDSNNSITLGLLGRAYLMRNVYQDKTNCIILLKDAIRLGNDGDRIQSLYVRAIINRNKPGDLDTAISIEESRFRNNPNPITLINLVKLLQNRNQANDLDYAILTIKNYIDNSEPNNKIKLMYANKLIVRNKTNDKIVASNILKELEGAKETSIKAKINLAEIHFINYNSKKDATEINQAILLYNEILNLDRNNYSALVGLSKANVYLKNQKLAIRYGELAIDKNLDNPNAYIKLCKTYFKFKLYWEATDAIKRGLARLPGNKELINTRRKMISNGEWEELDS